MDQCQSNLLPTIREDEIPFDAIDLFAVFLEGYDIEGEEQQEEKKEEAVGANTEEGDQDPHRVLSVKANYVFRASPTLTKFQCGPNFQLHYDTAAKVPWWTVERIIRRNVRTMEHTHGEKFKPNFNLPEGFRFANPKNNFNFELDYVQFPVPSRKVRKGASGHSIYNFKGPCVYCDRHPYLKTFYAYVTYLSQFFDNILILSGVVYTLKEESECQNGFTMDEVDVTHYFKVILCVNPTGTIRFECYKFKIDGPVDPNASLMRYNVTKDELEKDIGNTIFQEYSGFNIEDTRTHPGFIHRKHH